MQRILDENPKATSFLIFIKDEDGDRHDWDGSSFRTATQFDQSTRRAFTRNEFVRAWDEAQGIKEVKKYQGRLVYSPIQTGSLYS